MTSTQIVQTTYGAVRGERRDGVSIWRGIPYAASPAGSQRFQKPQPPERWKGVRGAMAFGPACPQSSRMIGRGAVPNVSEDCLTLNIWSPAADNMTPATGSRKLRRSLRQSALLPKALHTTGMRGSGASHIGANPRRFVPVVCCRGHKKRAVLFYIHGGSFSEGTGSDKEYEGTDLAREGDVVVVTMNYRLGAFGFMNFTFLDERFAANCGLWDILAALRWVHENIGAFGGDPDNVTMCGQSAGGICACILSMQDEARSYIKRAIMMSGVPTLLHTEEQSRQIARDFLDFLGITDAEGLLAISEETLAKRQNEFADAGLGVAAFAPCLEREMISQYPIRLAREGAAPEIPMLVGTTREEMSIVLEPILSGIVDINDLRKESLKAEKEETIERIKETYEKIYGKHGRRGRAINISDYVFRLPCVWFAQARSGNSKTWMYRFDYETFGMRISRLHAFHSSDVPFLFGNFGVGHARLMLLLTPVKKDVRKVHREVRGDFLMFMKEGTLPWETCEEEGGPAKCYAHHTIIEPAVPPEIMRAYNDADFKRRCLAGEPVAIR
ncbi:MAG: carboxylesterase family protein [Clostridiales bacterium]|nr:carboxylesterase family protein [Clostridiales bacterium]